METAIKQILRIKEIVSSLGLPHEEALTFMAGMFTQHFLAGQGSVSDEGRQPARLRAWGQDASMSKKATWKTRKCRKPWASRTERQTTWPKSWTCR